MKFDSNEDIILLIDMKGLYKINNSGKTLFKLPLKSLPKDVTKKYNFFNIEEDLVYYEKINGKAVIRIIDNEGEQKEELEVKRIIDDTTAIIDVKNLDDIQCILFKDKKVLSTDFNIHMNIRNKTEVILDDVGSNILNSIDGSIFKAYDNIGNSYWLCSDKLDTEEKFIIVLSNIGEVRDFFTTKLINDSLMAVSPQGEVFFIKTDEDGCKIFKTVRG